MKVTIYLDKKSAEIKKELFEQGCFSKFIQNKLKEYKESLQDGKQDN